MATSIVFGYTYGTYALCLPNSLRSGTDKLAFVTLAAAARAEAFGAIS